MKITIKNVKQLVLFEKELVVVKSSPPPPSLETTYAPLRSRLTAKNHGSSPAVLNQCAAAH
jgi:hypothetical protein